MHDLDRTMRESGYDSNREFDYEDEFSQDSEFDYEGEYDYEMDYEYDTEMMDSEQEESQLAFELLSVNNEEELDEFLGKLFSLGKKLIPKKYHNMIKDTAKGLIGAALPVVGNMVGGPIGGMVAGKAADFASNLFEIELEGLSPEDKEYELAKRTVQLVNEAIDNISQNMGKMPPEKAVKEGVKQAANVYAPGMLKPYNPQHGTRPMEGKWRREGNRIVIYGAYKNRTGI